MARGEDLGHSPTDLFSFKKKVNAIYIKERKVLNLFMFTVREYQQIFFTCTPVEKSCSRWPAFEFVPVWKDCCGVVKAVIKGDGQFIFQIVTHWALF